MIRKTIKGGDFKSQMVGELVFDQVPEEGSFNPVTSDAVAKAIDKAKDDMQEKIDEVTLDPSAVALGNVHLLDEVTEFPADGCILVDSDTNGPANMSKDTLLELTAQNALAGNVAQAFDPTRTSENPYLIGDLVVYDGKLYKFINNHYGAWNSNDVALASADDLFFKMNGEGEGDLNKHDVGIRVVNPTNNAPDGITTPVIVCTYSSSKTNTSKLQVLVSFGNDKIYFRSCYQANWLAWKELTTINYLTTFINYLVSNFDPTKNYKAGNFVYYNNAVYRFKTDHSAGGMNYSEVALANLNDICFPINSTNNLPNVASLNDLPIGVVLTTLSLSDAPTGFDTGASVVCTFGNSYTAKYKGQLIFDLVHNTVAFRTQYNNSWNSWVKLFTPVDYSYLDDFCGELANELFDDLSVHQTPQIAVDGYFVVAGNSSVSGADGYGITESITLNPGETIILYAQGFQTNVGIINLYDGEHYTCKVASYIENGNARHVYEYTNESNSVQTIRCSYSKANATKVYLIGKRKIRQEILPSVSMFETLGVLGDSYASGEMYDENNVLIGDIYKKSWPQILGRQNGVEVTNYSHGGLSTKSWLTNATYGAPKLLADDPLDAYSINLVKNDRSYYGADYLGLISDIHVGSPEQNEDSFYGNYARIIEIIKGHAPEAKIFCCQDENESTQLYIDYNNAIADIAELYGLPLVRLKNDPFFKSAIYTEKYASHLTYIGYSGMAVAMCRLFEQTMVLYKDYFKIYTRTPIS